MTEDRDYDEAHLEAVRERAARAKRREIDAHARAALLHDNAAATQDSLGHPDLAERARQRASRARADSSTAADEQADAKQSNERAHSD